MTRLGISGGSYGEETPVKFLISPFIALAYSPLTSLFEQTSTEASMYISRKISGLMSLAFFLSLLYGEIKDTQTMKPALVNKFATSAVLLIFSVLSLGEKSRFLFSPNLRLSPSNEKTLIFF